MTFTETVFEFDRPAEHGLAARTYGEGAFTRPETIDAVVDHIRDQTLRHYEPPLDVRIASAPAGSV